MLSDMLVLGGLMGVFVGLLEVSRRWDEMGPLSAEAALRRAMRGPDGTAVRAEFSRRGVVPVPGGRGVGGFGI